MKLLLLILLLAVCPAKAAVLNGAGLTNYPVAEAHNFQAPITTNLHNWPTNFFSITNYSDFVVTNVMNYGVDPTAASHIESMRRFDLLTNVIELLVKDGTFCAIRGHRWEFGCGMLGCLVIHHTPMRYCSICGKTQTQDTIWK